VANGRELGLIASVYTNDVHDALVTARRVRSGYAWINGVGLHYPAMPFGGMKNSGVGREEGIEEMLSYTETKAIHIVTKG
jgi:betaine-aldehyde dehydrogenase